MKSVKFSEYLDVRKRGCSLRTNFYSAYFNTGQGKKQKKVKENLSEFIGVVAIVGLGYIILTTDNFIINGFKEAFKYIVKQ